jgi:hypothetical protein
MKPGEPVVYTLAEAMDYEYSETVNREGPVQDEPVQDEPIGDEPAGDESVCGPDTDNGTLQKKPGDAYIPRERNPERSEVLSLLRQANSGIKSEIAEACATINKARAAAAIERIKDLEGLSERALRLTSPNQTVRARAAARDSIDVVKTLIVSLIEVLPDGGKNSRAGQLVYITNAIMPIYNLGWTEIVKSAIKQKVQMGSSSFMVFLAYVVERDDVDMASFLLGDGQHRGVLLSRVAFDEMVGDLLCNCCLRGKYEMAHVLLHTAHIEDKKLIALARTTVRAWGIASSRDKALAAAASHWMCNALTIRSKMLVMQIITPGDHDEQTLALMTLGIDLDVRGLESTLGGKILRSVTEIIDLELSVFAEWPAAMSGLISLYVVGVPGTEAQEQSPTPPAAESVHISVACNTIQRYGMYLRSCNPKMFEMLLVTVPDKALYHQIFQAQSSTSLGTSASSSPSPASSIANAPVALRGRPAWWDLRMVNFIQRCTDNTRHAIRVSFYRWRTGIV